MLFFVQKLEAGEHEVEDFIVIFFARILKTLRMEVNVWGLKNQMRQLFLCVAKSSMSFAERSRRPEALQW